MRHNRCDVMSDKTLINQNSLKILTILKMSNSKRGKVVKLEYVLHHYPCVQTRIPYCIINCVDQCVDDNL